MRERLVAALVGLTIGMILLYGVPRAYVIADLVGDQEQAKVEHSAELIAVIVGEREKNDEPVGPGLLTPLLASEAGIRYVDADGKVVEAGTQFTRDDDLVAERAVPGGGRITYTRSGDLVRDRVAEALWPLLTMGLGLIGLSAIVGWLLARNLARPFGQLAKAADRLGRGRFDLDLPAYTMPEAQRIGSALTRASTQLDDLLTREREFAANASHQLRTPITALRLTLEDISLWPETPRSVADELGCTLEELDRLNDAITELLALSRGRRVGEAVDLEMEGLVEEVARRWRPRLEAKDRRLVHDGRGEVVAHATAGPVQQVLDVLVDNACKYGQGTVTVAAVDRDDYVAVVVSDEGPLTITNEVFHRGISQPGVEPTDEASDQGREGHGLGLAIAAQLAVSMGGELVLAERPTTTFVLVLPVPDRDLPAEVVGLSGRSGRDA